VQREFDRDTNNFSLHIFYTNIEQLYTGYWPSENLQDLCRLQPVTILLAHVDSMMPFPNVVYTLMTDWKEKKNI